MTIATPDRAKHGYLLSKDEGDAYWLFGMLEIVKISRADTGSVGRSGSPFSMTT